jgi:hypothetical protein
LSSVFFYSKNNPRQKYRKVNKKKVYEITKKMIFFDRFVNFLCQQFKLSLGLFMPIRPVHVVFQIHYVFKSNILRNCTV